MTRPLAALALSALIAAVPAVTAGADTGLKRLGLRHETLGWEAVGRLDLDGTGFCTGALIAPDLVLTAAHCLVSSHTGNRVDPRFVTFRAALADGQAVAERRGRQAVVHPDYAHDDEDGVRQLRSDIALVRLETPIPAAEAAPFAIGEPKGAGDTVSVVSYARGRADALSWQRACGVKARGRGILLMSCDTDLGSSGAPVLDLSGGTPRIVSVISRGSRDGADVTVWGMEIADPLAETRRALDTGRGVWPLDEVAAKHLSVGTGPAAADRDAGDAKFLRP